MPVLIRFVFIVLVLSKPAFSKLIFIVLVFIIKPAFSLHRSNRRHHRAGKPTGAH